MEGNAAARVEKIMTQMAGKIALHWAAGTETGQVRQGNKDSA